MQEGPYFDELAIGQEFGSAPGLTLTSGLAAGHQAITGDRLALATDHELCRQVTGGDPLAPPSLVWDVAIGQSTVVTQHVKANLFYRGLAFRRAPRLGDTLRTSTRVVALRQNKPRAGRAPTGLAVLRITTADQEQRPVLDFWRCAMLPLRDRDQQTDPLPGGAGLVHLRSRVHAQAPVTDAGPGWPRGGIAPSGLGWPGAGPRGGAPRSEPNAPRDVLEWRYIAVLA